MAAGGRSNVFGVVVLVLAALGFAVFGVQWLIGPSAMAGPLGIVLTNGDATSDARAVYGGMELGLGLFLGISALSPARRNQGLLAATLVMGGLGSARLFGILVAHGVSGATMQLLTTDLFGTALCAAAFFVTRPKASA